MNKNQITIIARILAKEGKGDFVKSELLKLIDITRAEAGCINYDLHQDTKDPNLFLFYENWETRELWEDHINNQHLLDYLKATEDSIQEFAINEMKIIG